VLFRNWTTVALALIALTLAAWNARLCERVRLLEQPTASTARKIPAVPARLSDSPAAQTSPPLPPTLPAPSPSPDTADLSAALSRSAAPLRADPGSWPSRERWAGAYGKLEAGEFFRRVYLDLGGKLPAVETLSAFMADPSVDKWERLVERLLTWTSDGDDLSEPQKILLEELRKTRDLEAQVFRDRLQDIEERYERAVRGILDPDQLLRYGARKQR
jgi:hypothetical protein